MSHHTNLLTETISLRNSDEIGEIKEKLDLITVTTSKNLEDMNNGIIANGNVITTINDKRGLFTDCISFNINGAYEYSGLTNTGSAKSITNPLGVTHRRYILIREDTYDSSVVLSNNNTTFTPNETGDYLSIMNYEIYDNSADAKNIHLELYGHTEATSLQISRNTSVGSSTNYEYSKVSSSKIVSLTAGNQYYYKAYSTNGGVINALASLTNFKLIKMRDALS